MSNLKPKLAIIAPALAVGIFIIFVAAYKVVSRPITNEYSQGVFTTNPLNSTSTTKQKPSNGYTSKPLRNGHNNWQDSINIKHTVYDYATTSITTEETPKATVQARDTEQVQESNRNAVMAEIWSWIPNTSTKPSPAQPPVESAEQQAIRQYGNSVGKLVKDFSTGTGDQLQVMGDFMKDRADNANKQQVLNLAKSYTELSDKINKVSTPAGLESYGQGLAAAYRSTGEAMVMLAEVGADDTAALQQVTSYNEVVTEFARQFIKMADTFGAYGVTFDTGDDGDIFMPPVAQ
jgi:hypothetical protein